MYINGSFVTNNIGEYNITGAMVMGVTDVVLSGNSFRKQSQNVHSQGILLYDVRTLSIVNNVAEGNRFQRNGFVANVIEAQAKGSKNNEMNGNFWDSFECG